MRVAQEVVQDSLSSPKALLEASLTPAHRLLLADGFDHVIKADNVSDRHFKIFFVRNGRENARLGIVSSKKILPRAVDRNKAKRLIREIFRHHTLKGCKCDVVVMIRPLYRQESNRQNIDLDSLLTKVEYRCADW